MITSIHTLIYSDDAPATRAFLRDVLGLRYVEDSGSGPGWLIFKTGPSELAVHPTSGTYEGGPYSHPRHHMIALMCDDIHQTVTDLSAKGAKFSGEVEDMGFGRGVQLEVPGADPILLYQPSHPLAYDL